MINKNGLRRLARLHRLARQIAASLQADFDRQQALQVNEYAHPMLEWQYDGTPRSESAST
jgi:hypothetical protein